MTAVSSATVGRIRARTDGKMFFHVSTGTADVLTDGTRTIYVPMKQIQGLVVGVIQCVATSGTTKIEVCVASDRSGSDLTVVKDATVTLTTIGKKAFVEITGDEIKAAEVSAGVALPYLTVRLTCGSSADRAVVSFFMDPITFGGIPATDTWIPGLPIYNTDYT